MTSTVKKDTEKGSVRNSGLLHRLKNKLFHGVKGDKPAQQKSPPVVPKAKVPSDQHPPKRSLWKKLFGTRKNSQRRVSGQKFRKHQDPALSFSSLLYDPLAPPPLPIPKKKKQGFFNRLFKRKDKNRPGQEKLFAKPSGDRTGVNQDYRQTSRGDNKRRKNIISRIFSARDKNSLRSKSPSSQTQHLPEKEKIRILDFTPFFVNSTLMFILAYLVAYLTYQMAVIITASFFNIDSVLFFFEVMFPVGSTSELWTSFNIVLITISGPLTSLIAGALYYTFIVRRNKARGNKLMFFNWLIVHSFCMFFGAFVAGVITWQGFGYVINWMYLPVFLKILFSLFFLFFLAALGYSGTHYVFETFSPLIRSKGKTRFVFMLSQTIVPWVVGSLLLTAIKYPGYTPQHENIMVYDLIILVSVLFMIIPPFFNKQIRPHQDIDIKELRPPQISKKIILLTLIVLFVFRVGLSDGLHFVIQFAVNISSYK